MESEYMQQVRLVAWFRANYRDEVIFAIPNGGHRSKSQGLKLKNEGVLPGVPDLFIPGRRLFIEMKTEDGGTVSPAQKAMIQKLRDLGYRVEVCPGFESAKAVLLNG